MRCLGGCLSSLPPGMLELPWRKHQRTAFMDCLKPLEDGMVTSFMISRLQRVRHILLPLRRSLEAKHTNPGTLDSAFEFLSSTARGISGFQ